MDRSDRIARAKAGQLSEQELEALLDEIEQEPPLFLSNPAINPALHSATGPVRASGPWNPRTYAFKDPGRYDSALDDLQEAGGIEGSARDFIRQVGALIDWIKHASETASEKYEILDLLTAGRNSMYDLRRLWLTFVSRKSVLSDWPDGLKDKVMELVLDAPPGPEDKEVKPNWPDTALGPIAFFRAKIRKYTERGNRPRIPEGLVPPGWALPEIGFGAAMDRDMDAMLAAPWPSSTAQGGTGSS